MGYAHEGMVEAARNSHNGCTYPVDDRSNGSPSNGPTDTEYVTVTTWKWQQGRDK